MAVVQRVLYHNHGTKREHLSRDLSST